MIIGIVIRLSNVLIDTKFAERGVLPPNFSANIVVAAATGADAEIASEINKSPLSPKRYIINIISAGNIISLKSVANIQLKFFRVLNILLFARWKPISIIGKGVFRAATYDIG